VTEQPRSPARIAAVDFAVPARDEGEQHSGSANEVFCKLAGFAQGALDGSLAARLALAEVTEAPNNDSITQLELEQLAETTEDSADAVASKKQKDLTVLCQQACGVLMQASQDGTLESALSEIQQQLDSDQLPETAPLADSGIPELAKIPAAALDGNLHAIGVG
jgi:hypothetical protein